MRLWGGRFRKKTAPELERLGRSVDFDRRFAEQEIRINRAYARALRDRGLLTQTELEAIDQGLQKVAAQLAADPPPQLDDEDIHSAVERLLSEAIGEVAGKLATGRSRNDLSVTEFRLFLARSAQSIESLLRKVQAVLVSRAEESRECVMPGYTHLRRGQPVVFAQYLLAYFWALERDRERFVQARERCLLSAMGAGALAGNSFGVDREAIATELGFPALLENSIDAVSARDHVMELLAAAAILGTSLSRMAEDLILWSSAEFGFIEIDEAYATGSSLMPQKRNPDGLELVRGKSGRLIGNLTALLVTVKGLPTGYQRDLQEDKEPALDSLDTLESVLPVVEGTLHTLTLRPDRMQEALSSDLLATDLADYLVLKGLPFRQAHRVVGEVLAHAAEKDVDPARLTPAELKSFSELFENDVASVWDAKASLRRKTSRGGVAPEALAEQLRAAHQKLGAAD